MQHQRGRDWDGRRLGAEWLMCAVSGILELRSVALGGDDLEAVDKAPTG